jgi:hypothetical protein
MNGVNDGSAAAGGCAFFSFCTTLTSNLCVVMVTRFSFPFFSVSLLIVIVMILFFFLAAAHLIRAPLRSSHAWDPRHTEKTKA